ncbi:MAG: OprO/OprP family phosphate-selective porin [Planctomycetota bacterium]|jgi:phosphate-selective porin OprO/OprP
MAGEDTETTEVEKRLEEVLAELEAQRLEINSLKTQLAQTQNPDGIKAAVDAYLTTIEDDDDDPNELEVYWKNGIRLDSNDGNTKLKIGGRIMNDWVWADPNSELHAAAGPGGFTNMTVFRRARIYLAGTIYGNVEFKAQYDFDPPGPTDRQDVWIGVKDVPYVGSVRVGHQFEPFGLEQLTSSKYITFMERALPNALVPGRNTGVRMANTAMDGDLYWSAGVFSTTGSSGDGLISNDLTGRVAYKAFEDKENRHLVHVGANVSLRDPKSDTFAVGTGPEATATAPIIFTPVMDADDVNIYGADVAWVNGPLSAQAEYIWMDVDSTLGDNPTFKGYYAEVAYFITGESRPYKNGAFSRVSPKSNFDGNGGTGAWQVAVRYSSLDLDDGAIKGGDVQNLSFGVNWHLNPNTRVMINYVMSDADSPDFGTPAVSEDWEADVFMIRVQIDF